MKRVFLLPVVAAFGLCVASAADAKIASISFDGLCDGFDIVVERNAQIALETGNGCDEGANFGAGTIGNIRRQGRAITFAVNLSGKGGSAYQYVYVVSFPLVTGGTWSNFYTQDGKLVTKGGTGTYTVSNGPRHASGGTRSSTDLLRPAH